MRLSVSLVLLLLAGFTHASEAIWLDVRTPQEFAEGHLESAINIPFEQIKGSIREITLDTNSEIIVYCRSGRRAEIATTTLNQLGYKNVKNLQTLEAARAELENREH